MLELRQKAFFLRRIYDARRWAVVGGLRRKNFFIQF